MRSRRARPGSGARAVRARRRSTPSSRRAWAAFADLPPESLGRRVWEMYDGRGFALPGTPGGAPAYLAQHDFVHVLADYGTNLKGELEVFAFIGRADPDPKGFAWLATLIGLFETGYISSTGFFDRDVRERNIQAPGMHQRVADAIRRGKVVCERYGVDLFDVDYHELADRPVDEVREMLGIPPKSSGAIEGGSAGVVRPRRHVGEPAASRRAAPGRRRREPQLQPDDHRALRRPGDAHRDARRVGSQPGDGRHHGLHGHSPARRPREPGSVRDRRRLRRRRSRRVRGRRSARATTSGPRPRPGRRACSRSIDGEPEYHHYDELYRTDH